MEIKIKYSDQNGENCELFIDGESNNQNFVTLYTKIIPNKHREYFEQDLELKEMGDFSVEDLYVAISAFMQIKKMTDEKDR